MSDPRLPLSGSSSEIYRIIRKGSRYNIFGPEGRIFMKYKSASTAGPRWEELTHTPWPYESTAYERGFRLWQLGLIRREQVGKRHIVVRNKPPAQKHAPKPPKRRIVIKTFTTLALPAPRLDLEEHVRLMQALRRNPVLLFDAQTQQALRYEVEYHRPDAQWAQHLLKLLARYEKKHRQSTRISSRTVLEKHIAWQEQMAKA
jgi:hypothetical protein